MDDPSIVDSPEEIIDPDDEISCLALTLNAPCPHKGIGVELADHPFRDHSFVFKKLEEGGYSCAKLTNSHKFHLRTFLRYFTKPPEYIYVRVFKHKVVHE